MKKIVVSACLIGENCKYNGGNNYEPRFDRFLENYDEIIPVCPEMLGGLEAPRSPCEIVNGVVMNKDGENRDFEFRNGAKIALDIAKTKGAHIALLQTRSPSCGYGIIYDGSFTGKKIPGNGIFAQLLKDEGFEVINSDDVPNDIE